MFVRALWTFNCILWLLIIEQISAIGQMAKPKFELVSIEYNCTDEEKIKIDIRLHRMGRNGLAYSGTVDIKYNMNENTMVEGLLYRSHNGEDYEPLPHEMHNKPFPQFVAEYYETYWYPNFKLCANLPEPKNMLPWPQALYKFENCSLQDLKGFPDQIYEGFYKFILNVRGEVNWDVILLGREDSKFL